MSSNLKSDVLDEINGTVLYLKGLNTCLRKISGEFTSRKDIRNRANQISRIWYEKVKPKILFLGFDDSKLRIAEVNFEKLLQLSSGNSRISSYKECIEDLISNLTKVLIIEITKVSGQTKILQLEKILEHATTVEAEYLQEAINCSNSGYLRASVILGWSAAIARIHKVIEKIGFDEFNRKSLEMKNKTTGRYRRFTKSFDIGSKSELQTVFDTDLLWILEYWQLIDVNEHDRLEICFTMRNNAAHPGEAPITPENLLSFYSDLKKMVFDKENFKIS